MGALAGYLALGSIAEGSLNFTEIASAGAYARQAISMAPMAGGKVVNDAAIAFPAITGAQWSLFNAYAIYDAASNGNLLMAWRVNALEANKLAVGQRVRVPIGAIQLQFPVVLSNHGTEVILSGPYSLSPQGLFMTPSILAMTTAAYNALPSKDADTVYLTTGT